MASEIVWRAVGQNPDASRYGGILVRRHIVIALLLSGGEKGSEYFLELIPPAAHPMDVLRTGCSMLGAVLPEDQAHPAAEARALADAFIARHLASGAPGATQSREVP